MRELTRFVDRHTGITVMIVIFTVILILAILEEQSKPDVSDCRSACFHVSDKEELECLKECFSAVRAVKEREVNDK